MFFFNHFDNKLINQRIGFKWPGIIFKVMFRLKFGMSALNVPLIKRYDTSHGQKIRDHVAFYFQIKWAVSIHRGRHVNLNKPRFQIRVYQNIKPQNLKTRVYVAN